MFKKLAIILSVFLLSISVSSCSMLEEVVGKLMGTSIIGNTYVLEGFDIEMKPGSYYTLEQIENEAINQIGCTQFTVIDEENIECYIYGEYFIVNYYVVDDSMFLVSPYDNSIELELKITKNDIRIDVLQRPTILSYECEVLEGVFVKQ